MIWSTLKSDLLINNLIALGFTSSQIVITNLWRNRTRKWICYQQWLCLKIIIGRIFWTWINKVSLINVYYNSNSFSVVYVKKYFSSVIIRWQKIMFCKQNLLLYEKFVFFIRFFLYNSKNGFV